MGDGSTDGYTRPALTEFGASTEAIRKIRTQLGDSASVKIQMQEDLPDHIGRFAEELVRAYRAGRKAIFMGNGGSAADAQHLAAELIGRGTVDRPPLAALALNVNTSVLTAISNDFSYDVSFSRQVEALAEEGDVVVAISTSGRSRNVIEAVRAAKAKDTFTVALTGKTGGELATFVDLSLRVPSSDTARIQEGHITIGHIVCALVDEELSERAPAAPGRGSAALG